MGIARKGESAYVMVSGTTEKLNLLRTLSTMAPFLTFFLLSAWNLGSQVPRDRKQDGDGQEPGNITGPGPLHSRLPPGTFQSGHFSKCHSKNSQSGGLGLGEDRLLFMAKWMEDRKMKPTDIQRCLHFFTKCQPEPVVQCHEEQWSVLKGNKGSGIQESSSRP